MDMNDTIFIPNFDTTPLIQGQLGTIDTHAWLIQNMLIMKKQEARFHRDVRVERVAATTRIEGASMDEEAVGNLIRRPPARPTDDERENLSALDAYEFADYLSDQPDIPIDELVIRQLNRYFLQGASAVLTPGVYRNGQNKVGDRYDPPSHGDVPALMCAFANWLSRDSDDLHPALKAGIAHIHFVAIHPFWDGNGRTARALSTLILQRSTCNFRKLLSLESHLYHVREFGYFSAIERTLGREFTPKYDATEWLEFFTTSLAAQSLELTRQLTEWHRNIEQLREDLQALDMGLDDRNVDALAYASRMGKISRADYVEITGVSPVTASRDLARLTELGLLKPRGKGPSRVYEFSRVQPEIPPDQMPLPDISQE